MKYSEYVGDYSLDLEGEPDEIIKILKHLDKETEEEEITRTIEYADGRTETFIESNRNQDKDSTIVQNINIESSKTPEEIAKNIKASLRHMANELGQV